MKKSYLLLFICFFMIGIKLVQADVGDKTFGIRASVNGVKESVNGSSSQQNSLFNGSIVVSNDNLLIKSMNADYIDIENVENFVNKINITLEGDSTFGVWSGAMWSGTFYFEGIGSVKFIPARQEEDGDDKFVPNLTAGGLNVVYIDNLDEQKQWVQSHVVTELPITYKDGYVLINYKEPTNDIPPKDEQQTSYPAKDDSDSNNENKDSKNDEIKIDINDNKKKWIYIGAISSVVIAGATSAVFIIKKK